jgi:hypothetical protein
MEPQDAILSLSPEYAENDDYLEGYGKMKTHISFSFK